MGACVLISAGSQYGYTTEYAHWISEALTNHDNTINVTICATEQLCAENIQSADIVLIGASDYGTFLTGAKTTQKYAELLRPLPRVFFTVSFNGLEGSSRQKLDNMVIKNYGETLTENAKIFHFRGGLDHTKLSMKHKTLMMGVRAAIAAKPQRSQAQEQMLKSFEQGKVNYSDPIAVKPLVEHVLQTLATQQ